MQGHVLAVAAALALLGQLLLRALAPLDVGARGLAQLVDRGVERHAVEADLRYHLLELRLNVLGAARRGRAA